jgi:hypothetical protein
MMSGEKKVSFSQAVGQSTDSLRPDEKKSKNWQYPPRFPTGGMIYSCRDIRYESMCARAWLQCFTARLPVRSKYMEIE